MSGETLTQVPIWVTTLLSILSAILGGWIGHVFSSVRDRESKRRELLVRHKIELWNLIDSQNALAVRPGESTGPDQVGWERIVRDTQLLGTNFQIEQVRKIIDGMKNGTAVPFEMLLNSLRDELRQDLGLEQSVHSYFWLRVQKPSRT